MKIKVIKQQDKERRIRTDVTRKLLLDEKARLGRRLKEIDAVLKSGRLQAA